MRNYEGKNIRTFIGARNYEESKQFYRELGFQEIEISGDMTLFKINEQLSFYLQDYYVKEWVENSMVFLEVDNVDKCWEDLINRNLQSKYKYVRLTGMKTFEWGRECFLHDPSGVLWHFGQFN